MAVTKNAAGWIIMALSSTAIAWQCSPRVEIAEGSAGESGNGTTSGASFGGSTSSGSPGFGGDSGGTRAGSPSSGGASSPMGEAGAPSPSAGQGSVPIAGAGAAGAPAKCTPGVNPSCNDELAASSLWGRCEDDGTCTCNQGFVVNPKTGKCRPASALARDACAQPPDPGDCRDVGVPHYYFEMKTGTCELFDVHCGGEPRNANAFETLAQCEAACISPACAVPFVDGPCEGSVPIFSYDPLTGTCAPNVYGGCGGTPNRFSSADDCKAACTWTDGSSPAVTIAGRSCSGFGVNIASPGDEAQFERDGTVIKRTMQWGCGCAQRPEFVMMYSVSDPVELRLCHDELADSCEANCTAELSWDLAPAFEQAGTEAFVFVE